MAKKAIVFGAALDCLDDRERVGLKRAYLEAAARGKISVDLPADPYDAIAPLLESALEGAVELAGKIGLPGWLTPRPGPNDEERVDPRYYREFMDTGGPALVARACAEWSAAADPDLPLLLAVDHSLSAGPIGAMASIHGAENIAVVVLDSHFDAVPARLRAPRDSGFDWSGEGMCGDFLAGLMERGELLPERLFVAGVSDRPPAEYADTGYGKAYLGWVDKGVKIYPKSELRDRGFGKRLAADIAKSGAKLMYVSLDADVGACACMDAVRFMDTVGIDESSLLGLAGSLKALASQGIRLCGLDVSEVDVHFLGLVHPERGPDRTAQVCAGFVSALLAA